MSEASIIIIDDEKGIAKLCERLLEQADFSTATFNDPKLGVDTLEKKKFDLLRKVVRQEALSLEWREKFEKRL